MSGKRKARRVPQGFEPSARAPRAVAAVDAATGAGARPALGVGDSVLGRAGRRYPSLAEVSAAALASAIFAGSAGCAEVREALGRGLGGETAERAPIAREQQTGAGGGVAAGVGAGPTLPGPGGFGPLGHVAGPGPSGGGGAVLVPLGGGPAGPGTPAGGVGGPRIEPVDSFRTAGLAVPVRPGVGPEPHEDAPCDGAEPAGDMPPGGGTTALDDGSNVRPPTKPPHRPPSIRGRMPAVRPATDPRALGGAPPPVEPGLVEF